MKVSASSEPSGTAAACSNVSLSRLRSDHAALTHRHVLRVRAALEAEDLVAQPELGHGCADLLDDARELRAGDRPASGGERR